MRGGVALYSAADIAPHLDIAGLIEPMAAAFSAISQGRSQLAIDVLHPTDHSDMHIKSAMLQGAGIFTVKTAGWSDTNAGAGLPASTGMITVFDSASCHPIAILQDNHLISDYRTAAAGAVAAGALANPDIATVGVIGAGEQAFLQVMAVSEVRTPERIRLWNRSQTKAAQLQARLQQARPALIVEIVDSRQALVESADLLIIATSAKLPLVEASWLKPGVHITSVGADDATKCELTADCLKRADLIAVDSLDACVRYGNVHRALSQGLQREQLALRELGSVLTAEEAGRTAADQITVASLVGVGTQDLFAVMQLRAALGF